MNIKKAIKDIEVLREVFLDLSTNPADEELLDDVDFYLSQLQKDVYSKN